MKIIDLLNKIANGKVKDKTKFRIDFNNGLYRDFYYDAQEENELCCLKNISDDYSLYDDIKLTDEIQVLNQIEEKKKIPEKLPYYSMEKIRKAKNKDEWREERITLLEKRVNDLHIKMNDLLDYLKSKGNE